MKKVKATVEEIRDGFSSSLRAACGKPSPTKRLVIVLIIGGVLSVVSVCTLVRAIYDIGKRDAELIYIEHIKQLELKRNDSIKKHELNSKNYNYEYNK
jgi:hypothetical protein